MTTTIAKITGNTYPVKEQLKSLGGRWNPDEKCWEVPADKAEEAKALVANAPRRQLPGNSPAHKRCWECGCTFTWREAKLRGGDWSDSYCGC